MGAPSYPVILRGGRNSSLFRRTRLIDVLSKCVAKLGIAENGVFMALRKGLRASQAGEWPVPDIGVFASEQFRQYGFVR
jgi:hypothetical protein